MKKTNRKTNRPTKTTNIFQIDVHMTKKDAFVYVWRLDKRSDTKLDFQLYNVTPSSWNRLDKIISQIDPTNVELGLHDVKADFVLAMPL